MNTLKLKKKLNKVQAAVAAVRRRECGGTAATVRLQRRRCNLGFTRVPEFG